MVTQLLSSHKKMRMMINGFKERKKPAPILWSSRQGEKCGCSVVGRLGQTGMPLRPGLAVRGGVQSHRDSLPTSSVARTTHTHTCGNTSNAINTIARGQMLIHSTQWKGKAHKKNLDVWCHTCQILLTTESKPWVVCVNVIGWTHHTNIFRIFHNYTSLNTRNMLILEAIIYIRWVFLDGEVVREITTDIVGEVMDMVGRWWTWSRRWWT